MKTWVNSQSVGRDGVLSWEPSEMCHYSGIIQSRCVGLRDKRFVSFLNHAKSRLLTRQWKWRVLISCMSFLISELPHNATQRGALSREEQLSWVPSSVLYSETSVTLCKADRLSKPMSASVCTVTSFRSSERWASRLGGGWWWCMNPPYVQPASRKGFGAYPRQYRAQGWAAPWMGYLWVPQGHQLVFWPREESCVEKNTQTSRTQSVGWIQTHSPQGGKLQRSPLSPHAVAVRWCGRAGHLRCTQI